METIQIDDKIQVIWAVTLLAIVAMIALQGSAAANIVNSVVSGLFGVAVGKSLK